jgi:hypothetical protein
LNLAGDKILLVKVLTNRFRASWIFALQFSQGVFVGSVVMVSPLNPIEIFEKKLVIAIKTFVALLF